MVTAKQIRQILWLSEVEDYNYTAADSYLRIIFSSEKVTQMITKLRDTAIVDFKAKDIFRASQLSLLGVSNSHVEYERKKIIKGVSLSPLLLVRDKKNGKVVIADGYHRLCAIYEFDEDAVIRCKII